MPRRIRRVTEEAQHLTDEERRGQRLAQFAVYAELIYLLPARLTMGAQVRTPGYPARQTLVVATFVLTVAVVAAARRSRPAAAWSLLVPLAAATYATGWPRPTWVAGTSALLAAAILLVARRPAAWIPMAAVVAADVGLTYAAGARHISELAYPLTATVDDSLLLFAVAALGAAVRRMHEARRDLAAAAAAAERLRAGTDLAAALTIPLAEVRDRFERALCLLGAAPDRSATEVAAAVRLVRLGLRGVRSVSEPPPDRRAPRRPDASRRPSSPRPSWSSCWRATASRPWPTSTTSGRPGPPRWPARRCW
jgi:hypothetical protein